MNKHRDHRELGQILDLFSFHDIAPGAVFWHANGMVIFRVLETCVRQMNAARGYDEIATPIMVKSEVFKKSGHWDHYRNNMFYFINPVDTNEELTIKPMNCPESAYIFNTVTRSYRDMPLRLAEIGRLHRNELSGTLGGLLRVRELTMDDAHIYCRPDQAEEEIKNIINNITQFYGVFGLQPRYVLATRPEKFLGGAKDWDKAEQALKAALETAQAKYELAAGEGAFYGPKIEAHLCDSQDRDWQMGTVQLDLVMLSKQFKTMYVDEDGTKKIPWVIHRAIFGSFERFIGMLLEHTNGALPLWLRPVQTIVVTISDEYAQYAKEVYAALTERGVRAKLDMHNATVGKKIREAEIKRIPYIIIIGEKEARDRTVAVRQSSRQAIRQSSRQAIRQSSRQAIRQSSRQDVRTETKKLEEFLKEVVDAVKIPCI